MLCSKHRCNLFSCHCLVPNKQRRCELLKCNDASATYFIFLGHPHQLVSTESELGFCLLPPLLRSSYFSPLIFVSVGLYTSLSYTSRECPVFYLWYPQKFLEVYHIPHNIQYVSIPHKLFPFCVFYYYFFYTYCCTSFSLYTL